MNRTTPSSTSLLAVGGGLAVVLLAGCARTTSPRTAPAPDDQVSVGYRTQSTRRVTGAVTSISLTEADARVPRLVDVLEGRVPGLEVLPLRGGSYTVRIRGARSTERDPTDDEPLLVIDDLPVPRGSLGATLAGLTVRDVARIDVLKDAAASSIYGLRGAGGVIIITTKRGP